MKDGVWRSDNRKITHRQEQARCRRKMAAESVGLLDVDPKLQLLFFLCSTVILSFLTMFFSGKPPRKLPPGPPRLPVVGNLHQVLGDLPHRSFCRLSNQHGSLMHLQLGGVPALVISSTEMAQQVLRTYDLLFCNRPAFVSAVKFSYGGLDMAGAPYDDGLKQTRKLCMSELFSAKKVESSRPVREDEVGILVSTIARLSAAGPVNLSEMFICHFSNITRRQVSGRRVSEDGDCSKIKPLNELLLEINSLLGALSLSDFFPIMSWLDVLTGCHARLEKTFRDIDRFLEEEIDMDVAETSGSGDRKDSFIGTLLHLQSDPAFRLLLTRDKIKAILLDMFVGGAESSMSSLEWAMSELVCNPRAMKTAQAEVRRVAGAKVKVDEDDLQQLRYMKLVLKETWRLHPPGPLLVPRECRDDCNIGGYAVAKKTWVFVNVWAIGRDPKYWTDPHEFRPERFEDGCIDYKGQHFVLLPFGSGRRVCPGMALGAVGVELALANLLHRFDWELPEGVGKPGLDMGEALGLSNHRRTPLLLKATLANGTP